MTTRRRTAERPAGVIGPGHGDAVSRSTSTRMAPTGQAAAARRHVQLLVVVGLGHVHQRFVPDEAEHVRSEERALGVALAEW